MPELPDIKAYDGEGKYIFVSYSHKDKEKVYPFIAELQKKYNVWFDDGLYVGEDYRKQIAGKIKNCTLFIYMVTYNSLNSDFCQKEIYYADKRERKFINVIVDSDTAFPDWFELAYEPYQMCKLFEYPTLVAAIEHIERRCDLLSRVTKEKTDITELKDQSGLEKSDMEEPALGFFKKAICGDMEAMYQLGDCYCYGEGVECDYKKALECYKKAADHGILIARMRYENLLNEIKTQPETMELAMELLYPEEYKRAIYGDSDAQRWIGVYYFQGLVGTFDSYENYKKAAEWYTKASEQGSATAQFLLGMLYELGKGVPKDYRKALELFKSAAAQGHQMAAESYRKLKKRL